MFISPARGEGGARGEAALAKEYGLHDVDGRQPDFGGYFDDAVRAIVARGPADEGERSLVRARYYQIHVDPARAEEAGRMAALLGIAS